VEIESFLLEDDLFMVVLVTAGSFLVRYSLQLYSKRVLSAAQTLLSGQTYQVQSSSVAIDLEILGLAG
jgi:hypothetical protein